MPPYLFRASYTSSGVKGLLAEGGSARVKVVEKLVKSVGGKVEAQYWAFGDDDYFLIADLPDAAAAAAMSLTVSASDAVRVTTIPLLTAADVDDASKRSATYRAPGAKAK